jgi:hypothetical protein
VHLPDCLHLCVAAAGPVPPPNPRSQQLPLLNASDCSSVVPVTAALTTATLPPLLCSPASLSHCCYCCTSTAVATAPAEPTAAQSAASWLTQKLQVLQHCCCCCCAAAAAASSFLLLLLHQLSTASRLTRSRVTCRWCGPP